MSVFDAILGVIVLICALSCLIKGFVQEIFGKAAIIMGVLLAFMFYSKLDEKIVAAIKIPLLSKILSFILIFMVVFLVIKCISAILQNIFQGEILGSLDRVLGLLFGAIEGFAFSFLVIYLLTIQPWIPTDTLFEGSWFFSVFNSFLPIFQDSIKGSVRA